MMTRRRATRLAPLLLLAAVLAACSSNLAPAAHDVGVSNGTTLTVKLVVNGNLVGTFAPHSTSTAQVQATFPWAVEARAPSGRVLASMTVNAGDIIPPTQSGGNEVSSTSALVSLTCGQLAIYGGDVMPAGSSPAPGPPADCSP